MDPATAIGLVGSIIGIIGGVADASNAIGKIADRPQAFHMVENDLPLISSILERADSNYNDEQGRLAEKTLQACKDNAEELKRIFVEIEMKCNEDKEAEKWTWSRAREWYRAALKHKKSYKVEKLMTAILEGMEKLAIDRIFRLHEDMEKITDALKELQNVEASLEDYELEEHGINSVTNVSGHGSAQVNNSTGNNHKFFHNHFAETVNSVSFS
ncbi:hypothetical protein K4K61_001118 [Colletotrichum sp. SAR11_59]|nr:hypothetical protein K4K61_001118 [Colletotrichum sp. SAR11_59]